MATRRNADKFFGGLADSVGSVFQTGLGAGEAIIGAAGSVAGAVPGVVEAGGNLLGAGGDFLSNFGQFLPLIIIGVGGILLLILLIK